MFLQRSLFVMTLSLSALTALPLLAQERVIGLEARQELGLTVYQNGLTQVDEVRWLPLVEGENRISLTGVSNQLVLDSVTLGAADDLDLVSQSYLPANLTRSELLKQAVGQRVLLIREIPETGESEQLDAELLSMAGGTPVLDLGDRIEIDPPGRIALMTLPRDVPGGLRAEPALNLTVDSRRSGSGELPLTYLTEGLGWQASYVARLSEDDRLALTASVTLNNQTDVAFHDAGLRLVAGEVARNQMPRPTMLRASESMAADSMEQQEMGAPVSRADRYVYELEGTVSLQPGEQQQRRLFALEDIAAERIYRFDGLATAGGGQPDRPVSAGLHLAFVNDGETGQPLPAGTVRVYDRGEAKEAPLFAGEAPMDHTPEDGEVTLRLGEAFDVTATARQTDFERLSEESFEAAHEIVVKNAREMAVEVEVVGRMPQGARIREESAESEMEGAGRPVWTLEVPAKGETTLTYRVRVER
ncbi:DUF4139 domain-containing protein [Fodinicurvata fenggangensis]|uniref:DUF4139 domain-containing protein n=1 Tax=Fodinicurvata fenggangensis TaxID=1121830 RepID=UPI00047868BA|nr:DUF4139 domain-containing protein [Fodinicurvata fenggangensis]